MDIMINDTKVHYAVHGEGYPIVILHGFMLDHEIMLGALEPIFQERSGFKRIYPDMPGMGRTPATESIKSTEDIVALLNAFIEAIIPDQQFMLIGLSYGGYVARGVLKAKQALIDGLMLIVPVVDPQSHDKPEPMVIAYDPEAVALLPPEMAPTVLVNTTVQTKPIIQRIIKEFSAAFPRADQPFLAQLRQPERYCYSSDVNVLDTPFDKPTLIVTGKQDSNVGYANAFTLSRLYPRATYVALDRSGHGVHMEQDALFKLLVNEWLDRVNEAIHNVSSMTVQ